MKRRFYLWLSDLCHRARDWLDTQGDVYSYLAYKAGKAAITTKAYAELVETTTRARLPEIAANVARNNALLNALTKGRK